MIQTGIRIEGARIFRIVSTGTSISFTNWTMPMVLVVQRGKKTALSDDATGEGFKKTG